MAQFPDEGMVGEVVKDTVAKERSSGWFRRTFKDQEKGQRLVLRVPVLLALRQARPRGVGVGGGRQVGMAARVNVIRGRPAFSFGTAPFL